MADKGKGGGRMVSGPKIREYREALKNSSQGRQGSQTWLANQIGAHFTSISDWERGVNQPSPRHLRALADALGVRIDDLFAGDDDDEESSSSAEDMVAVLMPSRTLRQLIREEMRVAS